MKTDYHQTRHLLIIEDRKYRKTLSLQDEIYSIGRSPCNSIVIDSEQASRHHGTLMRRKNRKTNEENYWILDGDMDGNKSYNGIYINGEKCSVKELKQGDLINFGCEVNATFYTMNEWSDTIVPLTNYQQENTTKIQSKLISYSQAPLNPKATIQGQSYQDPLTKLANQQLFRQSLSLALKNATLKQSPLALLFLDINQFRAINENWGYSTGDLILQEIARLLNSSVRGSDIVARWSDDQFVILFPRIRESQEMGQISQRILQTIEQTLLVSEHKFSLEFSQGMAIYPQDGQDVDTLLKIAKVNLLDHQQKSASKRPLSQLIIKDKESKLLKIKTTLQKAFEQEEFSLYYQPKFNLETEKISGLEALVRWNHPQLGLIPPDKFVPLAEQTELICSLGEWILKKACSQNLAWQNLGLPPITVSVNLSPDQLQDPNFVQVVRQVLKDTKLAPEWLELEVTENIFFTHPEMAHRTLLDLKQLGLNLCLDDFGSGSSSFNHLLKFPFDTIKVAQSCVQELSKDQKQFAVISAVLSLATNLKIRAVAEGVETEKQLNLLRNLDCQEIQGYLFSQPLTSKEATRFLFMHSSQNMILRC